MAGPQREARCHVSDRSLHLDGRARWTYATRPEAGPRVSSSMLADAPAVLDELPALRSTAAAASAAATVAPDRTMQWQLAGADAVKLAVSHAGVVRVRRSRSSRPGCRWGRRSLLSRSFRAGRSVPRTVLAADGAPAAGRLGRVLRVWHGHPLLRFRRLLVGGGDGCRRELATASSAAQATGPASYLASVEIRERLTWFGAARNGDAEKFFGPAVYSQARQRALPVDALDVSASGARLEWRWRA